MKCGCNEAKRAIMPKLRKRKRHSRKKKSVKYVSFRTKTGKLVKFKVHKKKRKK